MNYSPSLYSTLLPLLFITSKQAISENPFLHLPTSSHINPGSPFAYYLYLIIYIYIYVILRCLSWHLPREEVHFWRLGNFLLAIYIYSPWDSRKVLDTKRIFEKCNSFFKLVQPTLLEKKSPPHSGLKHENQV